MYVCSLHFAVIFDKIAKGFSFFFLFSILELQDKVIHCLQFHLQFVRSFK